jgi:uncharacterized membrane protein YbhN (UPF0104 family)
MRGFRRSAGARRLIGSQSDRRWSRRRLWLNAAVLLVTLIFCYVALNHIRLGDGWKALQHSDYWWLIPALGAFALGNVARALRWRSLFPAGRRPPRTATLNAMMIGYLYNTVLPARAGEPARVAVLTQRSSSPAVEITGTVALERLYDVLGILAIFFLAWPWLPRVSWFGTAAIVAVALVLAVAIAAAVLACYGDRPCAYSCALCAASRRSQSSGSSGGWPSSFTDSVACAAGEWDSGR